MNLPIYDIMKNCLMDEINDMNSKIKNNISVKGLGNTGRIGS